MGKGVKPALRQSRVATRLFLAGPVCSPALPDRGRLPVPQFASSPLRRALSFPARLEIFDRALAESRARLVVVIALCSSYHFYQCPVCRRALFSHYAPNACPNCRMPFAPES